MLLYACINVAIYCFQFFFFSVSNVPNVKIKVLLNLSVTPFTGERGGSVVECRTPEREVRGSRPTAAVLCPWARHFTPRKYWLITQEAMAPSRHDWKIVDWDVKNQHNQPTNSIYCCMVNCGSTFIHPHDFTKFLNDATLKICSLIWMQARRYAIFYYKIIV